MSANYYLGTTPIESLGDSPRYWYALRRNEDGELFLLRSDQLKDKDSIELNSPGSREENFEDFEAGVDFFEGIDSDHNFEYENLVWTQYRWDNRNTLYYINSEGQFVQRINQSYSYPDGISSNG
jgi:hypothetical protein